MPITQRQSNYNLRQTRRIKSRTQKKQESDSEEHITSSSEEEIENDLYLNNSNKRANKKDITLKGISDLAIDNATAKSDENKLRTPRKKKSSNQIEFNGVTPPKQKKEIDENILMTPSTPSTLFKKLKITTPQSKGKTEEDLKSKNLFEEKNIYQNARRALHSTLPTCMPEREGQLMELRNFLMEHLNEKTSGTLYISGPPGTGKTASLSKILNDSEINSKFEKVYVNCTSIKSSGTIFSRIVKELKIKFTGKGEKDYLNSIENYLMKNHKMILLVLDEIDQLESKKQSILYTIFEWPSRPKSQIILIGIANALDLTDRILPRLQARCELKPKLMHFAPYTKQQIVSIFMARLKEAGVSDIFTPVALQMLAGKVAAISGDVRRALDIGRRVIELVEQNKKHDVLRSLQNIDIDMEGIKPLEEKAVELGQVVSVLNNIYGTTDKLSNEEEDSLPLQQKIIMCALLLLLKNAKNKDITIGRLHDTYKKVCLKQNILAVDQGEFVGLCTLIETRGIIRVSGKRERRLHKVHLEWDQEEVTAVLKDKKLLSVILEDSALLGKM